MEYGVGAALRTSSKEFGHSCEMSTWLVIMSAKKSSVVSTSSTSKFLPLMERDLRYLRAALYCSLFRQAGAVQVVGSYVLQRGGRRPRRDRHGRDAGDTAFLTAGVAL